MSWSWSTERLLDLYRCMVLVRRFEERCLSLHQRGHISGSIHLCIGREAVAVGAAAGLRDDDLVQATYRGHGHVLAHGVDIRAAPAQRRLGTPAPFDLDTILASVSRTSRVLIVHEGWRRGGFGAELAGTIQELAFDDLDAPIARLGARDVPKRASRAFDPVYMPTAETVAAALRIMVE